MFKTIATVWFLAALASAAVGQATDNDGDDDQRRGRGWNMLDGAKRSCVGLNGRPGICMGQSECTEANGKSVGRCFPFDACCSVTPNSCGGSSSSSPAYFQSPEKFQDVCSYKINVRRNICQIRIDFERFSIGQPTKLTSESAYTCERDEFTLITNGNTKINVPVLCGENAGQHVYVPVNQQQSESRSSNNNNNNNNNNKQQLTLKFRLTARDEDYTEPEPFWKLKITQLECQTTSTNWWKIKDIARQVWDWEDEERDASKSKYSLAPEGCLQYFTDRRGSFESFNYNRGMGHYLGNLNYATCFKRNQDTCGIKYEAVKFQMAYNQRLTGSTDRDCDTAADSGQTTPPAGTTPPPAGTTPPPAGTTPPPAGTTPPPAGTTPPPAGTTPPPAGTTPPPEGPPPNTKRDSEAQPDGRSRRRPSERGVHNDYLLIPDGLYSGSRFASKYCDKSLENIDDSTVKTQGPLYVAFVSDDYSNPNEDVEKGYKIDYSLTNTGC